VEMGVEFEAMVFGKKSRLFHIFEKILFGKWTDQIVLLFRLCGISLTMIEKFKKNRMR
jgi:hypothetical protein